jgi:hypothetical protein
MRWLFVSMIASCLLNLSGCIPLAPAQSTPTPGEVVILEAKVKDFLVDPPRSIILSTAVDGVTQVWLDESGGDGHLENRTQTYSANGCPLAGPPIQAGDTIKVSGRMDEASGRLIAASIWVLNVEIEGPCEGPSAE